MGNPLGIWGGTKMGEMEYWRTLTSREGGKTTRDPYLFVDVFFQEVATTFVVQQCHLRGSHSLFN